MAIPLSTTKIMPAPLSRGDFPDGFIFGSSSSDYQYEGARKKGGRGTSLWDTFCEEHDIQSGDAINQYDLYKGDVEMMKWMGLDACRISIGWSRVLPYGKKSGGLNVEGLQYYRNLIAELSDKGIETYVTLFHFDYPQALEDEYGGFRSPNIVDDFRDFADICFMVLGDSVRKWVTLNEPWIFSNYGYGNGSMAPGRGEAIDLDFMTSEGVASLISKDRYSYVIKSSKTKLNKPIDGDAAVEPYQVAHNLLLAHAAAVELYRDKYQSSQKGQIGITLNSIWYEPYSDCKRDHEARDRALEFILGWFMHPVTYGDYPEMMRTRVKSRLPLFTEKESKRLRGSYDFVGINYYSAMYAANVDEPHANARQTCFTDPGVKFLVEKDGKPIGEPAIPSV